MSPQAQYRGSPPGTATQGRRDPSGLGSVAGRRSTCDERGIKLLSHPRRFMSSGRHFCGPCPRASPVCAVSPTGRSQAPRALSRSALRAPSTSGTRTGSSTSYASDEQRRGRRVQHLPRPSRFDQNRSRHPGALVARRRAHSRDSGPRQGAWLCTSRRPQPCGAHRRYDGPAGRVPDRQGKTERPAALTGRGARAAKHGRPFAAVVIQRNRCQRSKHESVASQQFS